MLRKKFIANNKKILKAKYSVKPTLTIVDGKTTFYDDDHKHVNIAYKDLFETRPNERKTVRKVLLEGDVGIGKTALCVSVCNDWACEMHFHQIERLLYLPLHSEKLLSAHSLHELLKILHPSESTSITKCLEEEKGRNVLVIADGWEKVDEYEKRNESKSFLSALLFGSEYPDMSLLLTITCSSLTQFSKLKFIDRHVKILGFNKDCIKRFFESEVTDKNDTCSKLLMQLESNPVIEEVCRIPINCSIVCHQWPTNQEELPTTITKVYTRLTQGIIFSHIKRRKHVKPQSFGDIPKELHQPWKHLCDFAYETIARKHIVFSHHEISSDKHVKKCLQFGLLHPSKSY